MTLKSQCLNIRNVRYEETKADQSDLLSIYEASTITRINVGTNSQHSIRKIPKAINGPPEAKRLIIDSRYSK